MWFGSDDVVVPRQPARVANDRSRYRLGWSGCRAAHGDVDLYIRYGLTSEWDTAAGQCVLEQAGGGVAQMDGAPLRYNTKESLLNPDFLAFGDRSVDWAALLR